MRTGSGLSALMMFRFAEPAGAAEPAFAKARAVSSVAGTVASASLNPRLWLEVSRPISAFLS